MRVGVHNCDFELGFRGTVFDMFNATTRDNAHLRACKTDAQGRWEPWLTDSAGAWRDGAVKLTPHAMRIVVNAMALFLLSAQHWFVRFGMHVRVTRPLCSSKLVEHSHTHQCWSLLQCSGNCTNSGASCQRVFAPSEVKSCTWSFTVVASEQFTQRLRPGLRWRLVRRRRSSTVLLGPARVAKIGRAPRRRRAAAVRQDSGSFPTLQLCVASGGAADRYFYNSRIAACSRGNGRADRADFVLLLGRFPFRSDRVHPAQQRCALSVRLMLTSTESFVT